MSEVKVDIPRCGNCGATVQPAQVSCEYCGVRFANAAAPAPAAPVPVAFAAPTSAVPVPPPAPAPPVAVAAAAPAIDPALGPTSAAAGPRHHGHVAGDSPFARLTAVFSQIVSDPAMAPMWKHGCGAWQRWAAEEEISKRDIAASEKVEAVFTAAYLIPWYEDTFNPRQWRDLAAAMAAASLGCLDGPTIEASMEEWDGDLEDDDDDSWDAFVAWIAEMLPEAHLRRAAYEFAVAAAAIDGQRSESDAQVLDGLAEALEIPEKEALLLQTRVAQRFA